MMGSSWIFKIALSVALAAIINAQYAPYDSALVGTWSSKSNKVMTGSAFYDPTTDNLIEPALTGISYSFTSDGHYEEAYYRAISNPTTPACPAGIMQWQHGSYKILTNGSLVLTPIATDGRQLVSRPCSYSQSIYTRYDQPEFMKSYQVLQDPYHKVQRLNLYQFNGAPLQPLYIVSTTPQMLPTTTLSPSTTTSVAGATATGKSRIRRQVKEFSQHVLDVQVEAYDPGRLWWFGVGLTALGSVMFLLPTSW